MEECIAVIVPVYNTEKYLERCVDSILAQDYRNLDIVLVDDGSTDRSGDICDSFSRKDGRIKIFHKENGGILSAKRAGLENTAAEYILFVDSDDWIRPEMCTRLYETLKETDTDMAASGIIRVYPDGRERYDFNALAPGVYRGERYKSEIIPHMLCNGFFFQCGIDPSLAIKLFKRRLLYPQVKNAADYGFYYGEDTAVTYPCLLKGSSIAVLDQCFYYHRQYDDHTAFYTQQPDYVQKVNLLYRYLKGIFEWHEQREILMTQLDYYYSYSMYIRYVEEIKKTAAAVPRQTAVSYVFPFGRIPKGSRVVLYGAGDVGKIFYRQLQKLDYCSELFWVDRAYLSLRKQSLPVQSPAIEAAADYYVIAAANRGLAAQIKEELIKKGTDADKIIWEDPLLHMW